MSKISPFLRNKSLYLNKSINFKFVSIIPKTAGKKFNL